MNDEPPTPFDIAGDEPVEARIVAWVLGEASTFEAAELERLCEERPELLVFRRRMRALHGLLTEAEASEADHSWKLPPEKRKVLDEIFGEENGVRREANIIHAAIHKERSIQQSGRKALLAIAACVILTIVVVKLMGPVGRAVPIDFSQSAGSGDKASQPAVTDSPAESHALAKAIRDQEDKVEERRKVLATIVRTKGIIYKGQDSFYGQAGVDEDQAARGALETYNQLQQEKMQLESQVNSLLKYDNDQLLRYASGLDLPDNIIRNVYPQYLEANRQLNDLKIKGVGDRHPTVLAAGEQVKAMKNNLDEGIVNLRSTLHAKLSQTSDRLKKVEVMKDGTREDAIRRGLDAQDYVDAKRDYEKDFELLQAMRLKQMGQTISSQAPANSVAILDAPQSQAAPVNPASPPPAELASQSKFKLSPARKSSSEMEEGQLAVKREQLAASSKVAPPVVESEPVLPELAESSGVEPMPTQSGAFFAGAAGEGLELAGRSSWSQVQAGEKAVTDNLASGSSGSGGSASSNPLGGTVVKSLAVIPAPAESMFAFEAEDSTEMPAKPWASGPGQPKPRAIPAKENAVLGDLTQQTDSQLDVTLSPAMPSSLRSLGLSSNFRVDGDKSGSWNVEMAKKRFGADGKSDGSGIGNEYAYRLRSESSQLPEDSVEAAEGEPLAEAVPSEPTELMDDVQASDNPYSTFSLNISDASFQLAKAALAKGERPDPASIKPEQFYNAVDYGDPAPASNEPVAATIEQSAHPVIPGRNLVRVALRTGSVGRSAVQPLRLTLLVDQSGSMVREDRRASMEHALAQLGVLLTKNDLVTVIGFSRTPHLLAEGKAADGTLKLADLINQTASEGGTNLEEALKLGGQLAERYQLAGAQNRIVLFTDGAANLGDANPARLAEQVKAFRQKGLAFDIAGIGADGLNDRLLSELARNGNGRYYVVGDEKNDSFARQLAGAFRPAAENVKVQVNFNPQRVGKYKLIGFEKDRLKTEDFRNDAVDAAELAAEEAGVAIYQVEPLADGTGEIGEVSVRFRDAAGKEMVERTWTIPYESQTTAFDRATPSMQLAGLSLLAAEKLKGGPLADAIDFNLLANSSAFVKQFYGSSPRVADMLRVVDALK